MAPPFHFLERSFAPLLRKLGANVDLELRRLGFYPAGGGEIEATIWPAKDQIQPFDLNDRGAKVEDYAECFAPALPRSVARRELEQLGAGLGWSADQLREAPGRQNEGPGNALLATLVYENVCEVFTAFGEKGVSAEQVARGVVSEVSSYQGSDAVLGPHLADQWALPIALAVWQRGGAASFTCTELTPHAMTNFEVIERFLPVKFSTLAIAAGFAVKIQVS
jgi:RNA 3'-terminal phosphate cyclase (ATP)